MNQKYFEANKKTWDSRVEPHTKSEMYKMEAFMAGATSLTEIEKDALGDVSGKSLLHLQCHFGQDTISWARKGASATGIDFSGKAIAKAKELNKKLGMDARFIESNIYDLPDVLDEKFDIVFTSYGTTVWLPDLEKWAAIVSRYLKKGGLFYIAEFHPTLYMFNFENHQVEYSYFNKGEPFKEEVEGSYATSDSKAKGTEYFWNHSISEKVNALLNEGLTLLELNEYDFSPYNCFPNLVEREPGRYVWGADKFGVKMPMVLSLKMRKE
ncbi:MAG TPA: class I SAM-dependent methyltransferase [Bacteroidetes bacterium]|nr:class I SAM-dependent methyltransferase [Bacteroidota bacterium]